MAFSKTGEREKSKQKLFTIPEELKIETLKREIKIRVNDESLERLSLSKIIRAARKTQSHEFLLKIADYYAKNRWLWISGNLYELIGTSDSLQRAEKCYLEGRYYRSAIRVCKTIGTPEALKRANDYSCRIC